MVAIKPVQFNNTASMMVRAVVGDSLAKEVCISNFLKKANSTNTQGVALVDYFTSLNELKKEIFDFSRKERERLSKLYDIHNMINESVHSSPSMQVEADKFIHALNKNYPRTLTTRLALADEGVVTSYGVKKYSKIGKLWKNFKVIVNAALRVEC